MPEPAASHNGGIRAPLRPSENGHAKRPSALRARRRPSRIANIRMGLIAGIGVLILLLIFIVQNAHTVHVTFFGAHAMVSLAVALLLAAVAGALVMAAAGTARITQLRRTMHRRPGHTHAPASDTPRAGYRPGGPGVWTSAVSRPAMDRLDVTPYGNAKVAHTSPRAAGAPSAIPAVCHQRALDLTPHSSGMAQWTEDGGHAPGTHLPNCRP